ncbi:NlpC/P60 family protein [Myxococcus sp. K15C18031901]|uniref:NlpC/P60 family protein n=1 Tax=Myxococcus dinghuensis TaxID=2906761 RepID=UPI0020A7D07B|nr:NlpC/P60 family protein [Myxococcus dinghuensis]MCP3105212.1 NlpC/P60 family protein [Myxococcus dinghuensis]
MFRLHLFATVPLCALIGCATVKPLEAGSVTPARAPEVVAEAPVSPPAPPLGEGTIAPESASPVVAEAVTPVSPSVAEAQPPAPTVKSPEEEPARDARTPAVVSAVISEEKSRPLVTGVVAAALEAVALVTNPASDASGFWEAYRTPMQFARLIVNRSIQLVGERNLGRVSRGVPNDCSGFVRLAYLSAGIDLVAHGFLAGENAVSAIFRRATESGRLHHRAPRPGDLVFFRETYDRNRDGRRNDGMTHIGVVESLADDGTITFIHRGSKGVARSRMNLSFPEKHQLSEGGPVVNDFLRPATKHFRAYLTGELFVAFASPDGL